MIYIGEHKESSIYLGEVSQPNCYIGEYHTYPESGPEPIITAYTYGDAVFTFNAAVTEVPATGGTDLFTIYFTRPYTGTTTQGETVLSSWTGTEKIASVCDIAAEGDLSYFHDIPSTANTNSTFTISIDSNKEQLDDRELIISASTTWSGDTYWKWERVTLTADSSSFVDYVITSVKYDSVPASGGTVYPTITVVPVYEWDSGVRVSGDPTTEVTVLGCTGTTAGTYATGVYIGKNGAVSAATLGTTLTEESDEIADITAIQISYHDKVKMWLDGKQVFQDFNDREESSTMSIGDITVSPTSLSYGDVQVFVSKPWNTIVYTYTSTEVERVVEPATVIFTTTEGSLTDTKQAATSADSAYTKLTLGTTGTTTTVTVTATLDHDKSKTVSADITWTVPDTVKFTMETELDLYEYTVTDPDGNTYNVAEGAEVPYIEGDYVFYVKNDMDHSIVLKCEYYNGSVEEKVFGSLEVASGGVNTISIDLEQKLGTITTPFTLKWEEDD